MLEASLQEAVRDTTERPHCYSFLFTCLPVVTTNSLRERKRSFYREKRRKRRGRREATRQSVSPVGSLIIGIKIPLCAGKSLLPLRARRDFFPFFIEIPQTCCMPAVSVVLSLGYRLNPNVNGKLCFGFFFFLFYSLKANCSLLNATRKE